MAAKEEAKEAKAEIDNDDDDDPAIIIVWSSDAMIHEALGLPHLPPNLQQGGSPALSKANLVLWMDNIVLAAVRPAVNVFDRNANGKIDGHYSNIRNGELGHIFETLGETAVHRWRHELETHVPPITCGQMVVVYGGSGRGNSTTTHPKMGPFC